MAEPTSAYSLYDLMLRVAKAASVAYHGTTGQSRHLVPIDEFDFENCLQIVNDGIKFFIASAPPNGWRWMNRMATVTFDADGTGSDNINSDAARYQLSDDFQGEVTGPITYAADSNRTRIQWTSEANIRRKREASIIDGYPMFAAVRPYTGRRWELIVDPSPSAADTVTFPYRAGFAEMQARSGLADSATETTLVDSDLSIYPDDYFNGWMIEIVNGTGRNSYAAVTDFTSSTGTVTVADWLDASGGAGGTDPDADSMYFLHDGNGHPAGMQFDEAVLGACLAKAELEYPDIQVGYMQKFLEVDLKTAWQLDARSAPLKLGPMLPGSPAGFDPRVHRERTWNDITVS